MLGNTGPDSRVSAVLDQMGADYQVDDDHDFRLLFELGSGRSQVAIVNSRTERFGAFEIREVWSIAYTARGPLGTELANELLARNRRIKFGAWGLEQREDTRYVVFTVHLAAEADETALGHALELVLNMADQLEQELTGASDAL